MKGAVKKIVGGQEIVDRIWVPDTYVYNEHSSQYKDTYVGISSEGEVQWSRRAQFVITEVSCNIIIYNMMIYHYIHIYFCCSMDSPSLCFLLTPRDSKCCLKALNFPRRTLDIIGQASVSLHR